MKNTMFLCLGVSRVESTERLSFFSMVSASSGQEFEIGVTSCLLQRRVGADQRGAVDDQGMRFICPDDSPLCNVHIFVCLRARGAPISWLGDGTHLDWFMAWSAKIWAKSEFLRESARFALGLFL